MAYLRSGIGELTTDQAIDIVGSEHGPAPASSLPSFGTLLGIAAVGLIGYAVLIDPDAMSRVTKIWRK